MALAESQLPRQRFSVAWRLAGDETLARAAAAGDRNAFAALFARHQPALLRYCRSLLLDADAAEDAAQNTFAAALRAFGGSGRQPVAVKPWLFGIAHNEAMALLRARSAAAGSVPVSDALRHVGSIAAADDPVRERLRELVSDLHGLPERQRAALLMRELSGLTYGEISAALTISEGAARQAVCAARSGLHDMGAGRSAECVAVRRTVEGDDRRVLRGRAVRAHLAGCASCSSYARQTARRRGDLRILVPAGPALALTLLTGGGAAGGSAAGGGVAFGLGASSAAKCVALCASAAAIGVGGFTALEPDREPAPPASARSQVARVAPAARGHVVNPSAAGRSEAVGVPAATTAGPRDGAGRTASRPQSTVRVSVAPSRRAVRRVPPRPSTSALPDDGAADDQAAPPATIVASLPPAASGGDPPAPAVAPGAPPTTSTAATATPVLPSSPSRTTPTGVTALALADARARLDAALAAARQTTQQALAGATISRTQPGPSVAEALALLDSLLRGR